MEISTLLSIVTLISVVVLIFVFVRISQKLTAKDYTVLTDQLSRQITQLESSIRDEFARNREENQRNFRENREESVNQLKNFAEIISKTITDIGKLQKEQLENFALQLKSFQEQQNQIDKINRDELKTSLQSFEEKFATNVKDFNELQRLKLDTMLNQMEKMREIVENRIRLLQEENSKKLDEMRATVNEKLQDTLEKRLSESFKQVSERLEQVHKGLGEMQNLATGVGDLKKVLSNVKTRGILGEIQLGNILEQIMSPEQYDMNVHTKRNSRDNVEFAIKLPGKDDSGQVVYLPIDSKFPYEDYHALMDAYDAGDKQQIEEIVKSLENAIKKFARDIRDKYIDPPFTTDFGIMFLPVEGLYAEIVRRTSLLETLQRDYKIVVTGPTTLAAILNSLQMGFKTLAIEKRSSEVWTILGAVKTEFGRFGDVLKKAQEKILKAGEDIDELVGTRTRKIQSKLKQVQELPASESNMMLSDTTDEGD